VSRAPFRVVVLVCLAGLLPFSDAAAADRTNIPLKNWGGFSVFRDAVYDDLERLVTAGLADRVLLSTKPISRIEAARIVARAIENIRRDEAGTYNGRRDLEPVLDRLTVEFEVELASLGVRLSGDYDRAPGYFSLVPVDRAQAYAGYANHQFSLANNRGLSFKRGVNSGQTFESRAQVGDFLTVYLQPELLENEDFQAARLAAGYAKLTLFNLELLVGRDSLWWGPSLHGSLGLSNNAAPLDQVRIGSAEPFLLPWVGPWVGPTKVLFFLAQLESRRDHPRAKLSGMRLDVAPFRSLEIGAWRAVLFDGDDRPRLSLEDYPTAIFNPGAGDPINGSIGAPRFRNNSLYGLDADLRFHDVSQYYLPTRDLRVYGEFYSDDTCCNNNWFTANVLPRQGAIGWLAGVHFLGLLNQDGLDARAEYAKSSRDSYDHFQFTDGYWTRGHVISHSMGTHGEDYYARVSYRATRPLLIGIELNRAYVGSTIQGIVPLRQRRLGGGLDLSYSFWDRYSVFVQYLVSDVKNRQFVAGNDGFDHLLRVEFTRSFR